jgi:hypothetical protein
VFDLRRRVIDVIAAGPSSLVPVAAVVAIGAGVTADLVLELGSAPGSLPRENGIALWIARGLVVIGAVALAVWLLRRRRQAPGSELRSAVLLAGAIVATALLVPVYFLAARTHPTTLVWNHFGFLDRRWLTSLFLIGTAGAALALATAAQLVATALRRPSSWRAWIAELLPTRGGGEAAVVPPRRWGATIIKLGCAAAVAAYFFAPPWHLANTPIDYHEALTMGGVQAVRTGSIPYIDAAAVQYGPLAQVANVAYVGLTGHVSVDGFREVTLLFQWLAATIFLGVVAVRVRALVAAVIALAAVLVFPTLQTFAIDSTGTFTGFWGWTDALRYAGVFVLAMAFPAVAARGAVVPVRLRAAGLGLGWGVLCLVAQENLIGGVLALAILSVLLVVTDTIGRAAILRTLGAVAVGFLLAVVPACAYYAAHGDLGRFAEFYWLVPRAVAAGYSNTVFPNATYSRLFYGAPFLLGGLLLAALLVGRPLRVARQWSERRIVLVSALTAAVVSHLGSLTRSDAPHLVNTELALPAALCLAAFDLPALLGARTLRSRWIGGIAIVAATVAVLPFTPRVLDPAGTPDKLWRPLAARVDPHANVPVPANIPAGSLAAARIGDETVTRPRCCTKTHLPMVALVRFMDRLHAVIGRRRVFVDDTGVVTPPVAYFLADLRPAPFRQDYGTMVLNSDIRKVWLRHFRAHISQMQAVVTTRADRTVPRIWEEANPHHRTVVVPWAGFRVLVMLRTPPKQA